MIITSRISFHIQLKGCAMYDVNTFMLIKETLPWGSFTGVYVAFLVMHFDFVAQKSYHGQKRP